MKKFLAGLIVGCLFIGTCFAAQEAFTALKATFSILINGEKFVSDKPAVVVDGSTYLPLKAIGESLGIKISWNTEKKQVEIGESTPITSQFNFKNPAPLNINQVMFIDDYSIGKCKFEIAVKEVVRGDNAWYMLKEANSVWNQEPEEGFEYIAAKVYFKALVVPDNKKYNLNGNVHFNLVSEEGKEYSTEFTIIPPEPVLTCDLYEGATSEGWVAYKVKTEDKKPKLAFGRSYDGSGGVWFNAYSE